MTEAVNHEETSSKWRFWVSDCEAVLGETAVLVIIGTLNVFSSSFVIAGTNYDDPYFFLRKQGINVAVGIVCFLIGCCIDYRNLSKLRWTGAALVVGLLLAVVAVGVEVNGAKRWLSVGSFHLQPAELAKPTAIFLEAHYIARRIKKGMRCILLHNEFYAIALMAFMVEQEPDMGTAMIIFGTPMTMLFCSNMKAKTKMTFLGIAAAGGALLCIAQPYRMARVMSLLNPWADAQGAGYQIVQSLQAIGSGGIFGMGIGMGVSKYHYLPEAHTDFAFSVWCQEMGFVGALFVLVTFAALAYHGIRIANSAKDISGQMLAFGMTLLLVGQAVINLFMISGCLPVVGVPLPFISYGGTSLFVSMFAAGVLINVGLKGGENKEASVSAVRGAGKRMTAPPRASLRRVK